jgi:signal transduction histidine kinase
MWKYVLPPVVLVAGLWVAMSGATTFYVDWIERLHQRVVTENISSINAAEQLHRAAVRIGDNLPDDPGKFHRFWNLAQLELAESTQTLRESAHSTEEEEELERMAEAIGRLNAIVPTHSAADLPMATNQTIQTVRDLLTEINASALEMKAINQRFIADATAQRTSVGRFVFVSRLVLLLTGPIIGIWMGWRLSTRLQRSMARISVTLQQAESPQPLELGTVRWEADGVLDDVRQQAEQVATRLRTVLADLQQARDEVIRSERLAAVGELAAGVAHEIRNPLTSVKLLLQHAAKQRTANPLSESNLNLILDEIGRVEMIIQQLLDFSRPCKLQRRRHDLRETVHRALNLVDARARQHMVDICKRISEETLSVDGDPGQLHQVIVNLLINAIEAMPKGGKLFVSTLRPPADEFASIEIRDTGSGIPGELLPRLFEPFATTKEHGTGLGLAVSHRIIEQHGGTLSVENHSDGGAAFTIRLLLARQDENSSRELHESQSVIGH